MRTRVVARAWVSGRLAASPLLARSRRRLRFFWALDTISLAVAVTLASAAIYGGSYHPEGLSGLEAVLPLPVK